MAKLQKKLQPQDWPLATGHGVGAGISDFFLLGFSVDYNEYFVPRNPGVEEYTHVLHFKGFELADFHRIAYRLRRAWWSPAGKMLCVGNPESVFEIDPAGVNEVPVALPGVFSDIWGTDADHLFACGEFKTFAMAWQTGQWTVLPLPDQDPEAGLFGQIGFSDHDVYFFGSGGYALHYDGRQLVRITVPTDATLVCGALFDDRTLCIGGYGGTLLFGNKKGWQTIYTGTKEPLLSIAPFQGKICYPTPKGVFAFDGTNRPQLLIDQPANWINGLGDGLTLTDGVSTWIFDGSQLILLDTEIHTP